MNIFFLEGIIKILEERMAGIFVAEDAFGFGNLPVDAQGRIRQEDASVGFGMVELIAFVREDGLLAQHAEAVGKPLGDIELQVVVLVEFNGKMLSEGGAVFTQIYCHIEYASVGTTDEFGLGIRRALEMQSAHHAVRRARLIILNETGIDTGCTVSFFLIGLSKPPPRVAEELGLDDQQTFNGCFDYIHGRCQLSTINYQLSTVN